MITILSPAKTIDENPVERFSYLEDPIFLKEANYLAGLLKKTSSARLRKLMSISQDLSQLNQQRFTNWNPDSELWQDIPALLAFKGEVFRGAKAWDWTDKELKYSINHLLILSGLFGVLRPNDKIRPYRLEMGIPLNNRLGSDLYSFWRKKLTITVQEIIDNDGSGILVNLASKEYFKVLDQKKIKARIITPNFKDFHNGEYRFLTVYGKHARGEMTRFINTNQLSDAEDIKAFNTNGYTFNSRLSMEDDWVFTRG